MEFGQQPLRVLDGLSGGWPEDEEEVAVTNQRWGHQTELAVANFRISSQTMPQEIVYALANIKRHAAAVNADYSVISYEIAAAIESAATEIAHGEHDDQFPVDVFQTGSGTSSNMNVNEVIAHRASELAGSPVHPNDHVNASQSSNDVFPTALRIAALSAVINDVIPSQNRLVVVLEDLAGQHHLTVKAGRTHMMDAAPMTFGQEVNAWCRSIKLGIERLNGVTGRLGELPLGGTAVGTGLNAPAGFAGEVIRRLAAELALPIREATDHFEAQAWQEPLLETSAMIRSVALSLNKIAGDLRLLSSGPLNGLGELRLPELQAGSSIMPGKVNPVIPEVVQQVAAQVVGHDAAITFASATCSSLQLNTAMPLIGRNLLESLHLVAAASTALGDSCLSGLRVEVEAMKNYAERSPAIAAALNPLIGYDAAAEITRRAISQSQSIGDAAREAGIDDEETLRRLDPLVLALDGALPPKPRTSS